MVTNDQSKLNSYDTIASDSEGTVTLKLENHCCYNNTQNINQKTVGAVAALASLFFLGIIIGGALLDKYITFGNHTISALTISVSAPLLMLSLFLTCYGCCDKVQGEETESLV